jgi:hypothetical protein
MQVPRQLQGQTIVQATIDIGHYACKEPDNNVHSPPRGFHARIALSVG